MKKLLTIIIMISLIAPMISGTTIKIYPSEDAQVSSSSPGTNYGAVQDLGVGLNGIRGKYRSLVKFNLANLSGKTVNSAAFSIEPNNNQNNPAINLYLVQANAWTEAGVKWSNQPNYTALLGSRQVSGLNRISFDVKSYVNGTQVSFIMIEEGENQFAQFFSREYFSVGGEEDNTRKPYIIVDYSGGGCNTAADSNCDGHVSLTEYNTFKYNFKNGLLPGVTLTEYNTIKYNFKNGLLS